MGTWAIFESDFDCLTENKNWLINMSHTKARVGIVFPSDEVLKIIDDTIRTKQRSQLTYSLINSYGLLNIMTKVPFKIVDEEKLKLAHSPDYIRALKSCNKSSEGDYYDKYGLSYDCPPRDELYKRALLIYSSTMSCAFALLENKFDICLNWLGGWHHAKRSKASGFCYVNDINGAINYFVQNKKKVLYIDLDVHHGDGVEEEFKLSPKVLTYSIHHFAAGFFPNTGNISPNNAYSLNVPLRLNVPDRDWIELNQFGIGHAFKSFQPDIMVIQAGGDSLYNDDHKALKVTSNGYLKVINFILKYRKPTLILGGGGYNEPATSKLWTQITALSNGKTLRDDIPSMDPYFLQYGPDLTLNESEDCPPGVPMSTADIETIKNNIKMKTSKIQDLTSNMPKLSKRPFRKRPFRELENQDDDFDDVRIS